MASICLVVCHRLDIAEPCSVTTEQAPTSSLRSRRDWLWPLAIALLVVTASHRSQVASPDIANIDKVTHFSVFGLLATLVCRLGSGWRAAVYAWIAVAVFGMLDEWHQSFVPGRSTELADWIADSLGAAVAVFLYTKWHRYRRLLETPCWRRKSVPIQGS